MRLTRLPTAEPRQLHFLADHDRGTSRLILGFWLGRPAGFTHRFEAWSLTSDGQRADTPESDEIMAVPGADIRKILLTHLPELLEVRALSNHALVEITPLLDEIVAFERELEPNPHPFAV